MLGSARRPQSGRSLGWNLTSIFCLFTVLALIVTLNVFIVSFVWERLVLADHMKSPQSEQDPASKLQRARQNQPELSSSRPRLREFFASGEFSALSFTRQSVQCRWDDCRRLADDYQTSSTPWTDSHLLACASGLLEPRSKLEPPKHNSMVVPLDSPCVDKDRLATAEGDNHLCRRAREVSTFVILVDEPWPRGEINTLMDEFAYLLERDESFSAGLGLNVRVVRSPEEAHSDWDVRITSHFGGPRQGRLHLIDEEVPSQLGGCIRYRRTVSVHRGAVQSDATLVNSLYGSLRHMVAEALIKLRAPPEDIAIAVFIVWAGIKPPPFHLYNVALSFIRSDPRFHCFIMIEEMMSAEFKDAFQTYGFSSEEAERVQVVTHYDERSGGNLTHFIHSRGDELVPNIKGHHHYALGWSLCDFRWLFGEIFKQFIPETRFSHWAWADSDAFAGKLLGSFSDFGHDYARHDVVSYAATILEPKAPASSMIAYTSGTFTVIRNTEHGRNLFRLTPSNILERALVRSSNAIMDEMGTSNAVLSAPGVSVALIGSQARYHGSIQDKSSSRLFYVARDEKEASTLEQLSRLGRISEPFATAPLGAARVLARFKGGAPLPRQEQYKRDTRGDPKWYAPPHINKEQFANFLSPGAGFATLLRDSKGYWWHRPLSPDTVFRSRDRSTSTMDADRPIVRVEVAIVHSRMGGPCNIDGEITSWDFALARSGILMKPGLLKHTGECSVFKHFFK